MTLTQRLLAAAAVVGAATTLGAAGMWAVDAAVTSVGGQEHPYASDKAVKAISKNYWQLASQVKDLIRSGDRKQDANTAMFLQNAADTCDDHTTVLNIQAKAEHSATLRALADKTAKHCDELHSQAEAANNKLLGIKP